MELVVYALMAAFIFFRLYSSFGRSSDLNLNPINTARDEIKDIILKDVDAVEVNEDSFFAKMDDDKILAMKNSIKSIAEKDKEFSLSNFVASSVIVFEYVMTAFNKGDKLLLQNLLNDKLYNIFLAEIEKREKLSEVHDGVLVRVKYQEIVEVRLDIDGNAFIAVRFITEQINFAKNKDGDLISGSLTKINVVEDLWLFHRNINSNDHKWYLISTDHKI